MTQKCCKGSESKACPQFTSSILHFGAVLLFELTNWCGTNRVLKCQRFPPQKSGVREDKWSLMAATGRTFLDPMGPSRPYSNHLEKLTRQEERGHIAEPVGLELGQETISNPLPAPTTHPLPPKGNFWPFQFTRVTSFSSPTSAQV